MGVKFSPDVWDSSLYSFLELFLISQWFSCAGPRKKNSQQIDTFPSSSKYLVSRCFDPEIPRKRRVFRTAKKTNHLWVTLKYILAAKTKDLVLRLFLGGKSLPIPAMCEMSTYTLLIFYGKCIGQYTILHGCYGLWVRLMTSSG